MMTMKFLLLSFFIAVVSCVPLQNDTNVLSTAIGRLGLSEADYHFLKTLPKQRLAALPGFSYLFVNEGGQVVNTRGSSGTQVDVAGSPGTTSMAIQAAASVVSRMVKYMPHEVFQRLASNAAVGVFSAAEKLIVYPEYAYLANGNCGSSCSGSCSQTCTFDGRKYEDLAGVGGRTGVILDDNVLCTAQDPYLNQHNILAHEFTHTIHEYGLSSSTKNQVTNAYQTAKSQATWTLSSYAMANEQEYLAEAATVFFGVNKDSVVHPGGMNLCNGVVCADETAGRENLRVKDPLAYNVLSYIFTNNRPYLSSGMTICPDPAIFG